MKTVGELFAQSLATDFLADVTDGMLIRYIRYPSVANAYSIACSIVSARPSA